MEIKAGFLIVKTYPKIYQENAARYHLTRDFYGIPRIDKTPDTFNYQYRGIYRDALFAYEYDDDYPAQIRMAKLEEEKLCEDSFILSEDALKEVELIIQNKNDYETIWARIAYSGIQAPASFKSVGYEPTYFYGNQFSASCDSMFIPRWHGTDKEGTLFQGYFKQTNQYGLFDSPGIAQGFLDYYLSFDWTETGDYKIAEIFLQEE